MKKILIIFDGDKYIRNHYLNKSFRYIEREFNVDYLITQHVKTFKNLLLKRKKLVNKINFKFENKKIYEILLDSLLIANKKKSKSFTYRLMMKLNHNLIDIFRGPYYQIPIKIMNILYRYIKFYTIRYAISFFLKSSLIVKRLFSFVKIDNKFDRLIKKKKYDLILIPTSGHHINIMKIIKNAKLNNIKTFLIIDNWDNLSSKIVMWVKPDYIGVWGEQTKRHAIEIHNFDKKKCFIIGASKYEEYFKLRKKKISKIFNFRYVLFLGTSWHWDEEHVLDELDKILSGLGNLNIKIIYRPHPSRQGKVTIIRKFKNIVYDPEIVSILNKSTHKQTNLNYYPSLISNSLFVMGGPQTMTIETTIFGKNFLALIHNDFKNNSNMHKVFKSYKHFRGMEKLKNIFFCDNLINLEAKFTKLLHFKKYDLTKLDKTRNKILYNDKIMYSKRLYNITNKILSNQM